MIYRLNDEKYNLCKNYVIRVYEGNKSDIKLDDASNIVIVNDNDVNDFMDAADYAIIHFGMINKDYLNDLGCKLQELYDEIYYQTKNNAE